MNSSRRNIKQLAFLESEFCSVLGSMSTSTHKRADDLARVQMAITTQTELVQAVYETGKPVPKEDRETFRKENNFMNIAF